MIIRKGVENEAGILLFASNIAENHEDYNAAGLDILYAAEEKHFWFLTRKQRIINVFQQYVQTHESVLEIGAGTGNVARALQKAGYDVSVGEMHLNGLYYAKSYGIKNCYQFDLFEPPFSEHFDVIGLFDVLEHLQEDVLAMQRVQSMLKPKGRVVLTVPAHQWLWNRDDAIAAHKRRYTLRSLKVVMEKAGFEILHGHYFFVSILPLLLLRRILNADNRSQVEEKEHHQEININPLINRILLKMSLLENRFASWMPNLAGGSIILIAKKKPL